MYTISGIKYIRIVMQPYQCPSPDPMIIPNWDCAHKTVAPQAPGSHYSVFGYYELDHSRYLRISRIVPFASSSFHSACFWSSSMLQHVSEFPSLVRLSRISVYVYTFCLSVHPPVDIRVVSTFWLLWKVLLWTWTYRHLFEPLLSVLWGMYAEVELLDRIVNLCLVFWETIILFSTVAATIFPTSSTQGLQFLHILPTLVVFCSFWQ